MKNILSITLFTVIFLSYTAKAGTLTVTGNGADLRLTNSNSPSSPVFASFNNGIAIFSNVPSGVLLYLGSTGSRGAGSSKISRFSFEENGKVQSFGASVGHDELEIFNTSNISGNNLDFISLVFNPNSPAPDRLFVGEAPSSATGSAQPVMGFGVNGVHYSDIIYNPGSGLLAACETFGFSSTLRCHGRFVNNINRFWFNGDREANFRGVVLRQGGANLANNRFFFRYGNVNFRPTPDEIPRLGPAPRCWEYYQNF